MSRMSTCANSNNQLASSGRFGQVLFFARAIDLDLNRSSTYPGANPQKGTVLCIIKLFNQSTSSY